MNNITADQTIKSRSGAQNYKRRLMLGAVGVIMMDPASIALAQTPHEQTAQIEEVVVTARRTEEALSKVPVSVSVLGATALQEQRILTEADLQLATPGLTVRQTNSSNQVFFALRGQSLDAFSFAAPSVLTYVNEFNAQGVSASTFYDLDSIQVLKGPQGTLFGRNATGGAVLYQTVRPKNEFGGYAKASLGNYDSRLFEGAVNLPLGPMGAFRLAAQHQKRDGYQENLFLNKKQGAVDSISIRPSLILTPFEGFENFTVFQYTRTGGSSTGLRGANFYKLGQFNGTTPLVAGIESSAIYPAGVALINPRLSQLGIDGLEDYFNKQAGLGFYTILNNQDGRHRARQYTVTNTSTYVLAENMQLKNIFGYNHARSRDNTDVDSTPFEPLTIGNASGTAAEGYTYSQSQLSEELQLTGEAFDDRLKYITGVYYFSGKDAQRIPLVVAPDVVGGPFANFLRQYLSKAESKAVYGQFTYSLTDQIHATLGGRYTWEKSTLIPFDNGIPGYQPLTDDANISAGLLPQSLKAHKPSWQVSLDYQVTPEMLVYAVHRGSWRTGGYNGTAAPTVVNGVVVANSFKPETTYDFEVGAKFNGLIGSIPTTVNIAVYDQYIKNVIRAIYTGVAAVSGNVGKAHVTGVEADMVIHPTDWLQLGGTLAYTNGRYTDPVAILDNKAYVFGPYGDTPKLNGSAFVRLSHDLANNLGEVALRGDLYAQSKFFYSNAEATILPGTSIPHYTLLDARLEWNGVAGSRVNVAAYVKNLTNRKYSSGGFALAAVTATNGTLPGTPRFYGLEFDVKF